MTQTRLLEDVLLLLILGLFIYMSVRSYQVYKQVNSQEISQGVDFTGLDEELSGAVTSMEASISQRQKFRFAMKKNPMDATKIIVFDFSDLFRYRELMERQNIMRLSCTVVDENPSAIIKYMGKSHILHIGEEIANKKVVEITKDSVKFADGDMLYPEKAPTIEELMREQSNI